MAELTGYYFFSEYLSEGTAAAQFGRQTERPALQGAPFCWITCILGNAKLLKLHRYNMKFKSSAWWPHKAKPPRMGRFCLG
jgi:hypothetical protein